MSLWLALGAMTALAALLVAWPLLRRPAPRSGRRDYELRVYRAQLEELERERERGLLDLREAAAAKLEVERRMLAADATAKRPATRPGATGARWAMALAVALPLLAAGLYWRAGRPDLPALPFAGRTDERSAAASPGQAGLPSVETMITRLEQRVKEAPNDLEAWARLGQAYDMTEQFDRSVHAWRRAVALDDGDARLRAALGEALVMADGGVVTPAAKSAFDRALALDPAEPRARFYQGLGLLQAGERQGAYDTWAALIESSPGDAPWVPELQRRVASLADDLGLGPADLPAPAAPSDGGPSAEQMEAAKNMAPTQREAMIRDMVAGLAARLEKQPDDIEGWRRLGRSYQVLGEPQKAADAWRHVAEAAPDDLGAQIAYADALLAAGPKGQPADGASPAAIEQMRRVLALDPQNPLALFYLGEAAAKEGDAATARAHWQRLIEQIPEDRPERAQIQRLIDQLPAPD